jgi:protein SCO1/2
MRRRRGEDGQGSRGAPGRAGRRRARARPRRAPAVAPSGDSIYAAGLALQDQTGRRVGLDVFRGHPVLIAMFYGTCRDACPLLLADLHRIERALPPAARADLRVVLVTLDPRRDTPAALGALARAHGVDPSRWRLLQPAGDDAVRTIAALLGVRYRRLADGNFNHSSLITLLDAAGAVVARLEGAGQPIDALAARVPALAAPRAGR